MVLLHSLFLSPKTVACGSDMSCCVLADRDSWTTLFIPACSRWGGWRTEVLLAAFIHNIDPEALVLQLKICKKEL